MKIKPWADSKLSENGPELVGPVMGQTIPLMDCINSI